ncbi:MAG: reverse transcriptase [Candidatus Brocadiaceae bacterium]|nr:reverse transcriptase [Candidatus Brocadiaceae bacterium]
MKRAANLFEDIADLENLYFAYFKARKGKSGRAEVMRFRDNLHCELLSLRDDLMSGAITIGNYHYFEVRDPKQRQICAASFRERVLHHAIINVCGPYFEKFLIYDTYACIKGKGSQKAVERAQIFSRRNKFFLKLDIAKYFHSIDHTVLIRLIESMFKDEDLLHLFYEIVVSFEVAPGKGIPIGNLTSQYFANYYLGYLDHFIKEQLCIKYYVRYMDDFTVWSDDKKELKDALGKIKLFLTEKLLLDIKEPMQLNYSNRGVEFLGYRVFPDKIRLAKRSKRRFVKKFRDYECLYLSGKWSEDELVRHMLPLVAFTEHADAKAFRKNVIERYGVVS